MNTLRSAIDRNRRAVSSAFDRAKTITGDAKPSKELKTYEKLTPREFEILGRVFGEEQLMAYIRTMEARRMKNNG